MLQLFEPLFDYDTSSVSKLGNYIGYWMKNKTTSLLGVPRKGDRRWGFAVVTASAFECLSNSGGGRRFWVVTSLASSQHIKRNHRYSQQICFGWVKVVGSPPTFLKYKLLNLQLRRLSTHFDGIGLYDYMLAIPSWHCLSIPWGWHRFRDWLAAGACHPLGTGHSEGQGGTLWKWWC